MTKWTTQLSNKTYLLIGLALFLVEVLIALFVRDRIIRPYGGDLLVVVMLYFLVRGMVNWSPLWVALSVLGFAFVVELAQYLDLLTWLGWQENTLARVVLGSEFSWGDMIAYALGAVVAYFVDQWLVGRRGMKV